MTTLREGKLEFSFDESWTVLKYDDQPEYRNKIEKLDGTKAVDFIGIYSTTEPLQYFLEIKDFTGYETENKRRINSDLALEFALKVRDTVAGLVGVSKTSSEPEKWQEHLQLLFKNDSSLKVILFVKGMPTFGRPGSSKNQADVLTNAIKGKLKWLTSRVQVVDSLQNLERIGVSVKQLSRGDTD